MTRSKALQERYDTLHGRGHADRKTFEALKRYIEEFGCEVTVIREKENVVYFKFLTKEELKQ